MTAVPATVENTTTMLPTTMSPAMAIMLDDKLFERAKLIAKYLSAADGFTPPHLIGKTEACFAVVTRALTWKLDPYAVAACTYQTPGGRVGFEGKLCQAILENSGRLEGPVEYDHIGDWSKIAGKFQIRKSDKGKDFAVPTWTREDAQKHQLGVIVRAQVKGERKPRAWTFMLEQAFPLNSTLWATDPKSQICYTAVRRFGNLAAPGLFMGVPFDRDDMAERPMRVVGETAPPRPKRSDFEEKATDVAEADAGYATANHDPETGEVIEPEEDEGISEREQAWLEERYATIETAENVTELAEMQEGYRATCDVMGISTAGRQALAAAFLERQQMLIGARARR